MRISFVTDTWLPEINGVTTVLEMMDRGLRRRGHAVQVIAPRYVPQGTDPRDVVRRPSIAMPGYAHSRLALPFDRGTGKALRKFRPDLVHVVTEGPLGAAGRRFAIDTGVPFVTSFHTDFPRYAARYLGRWAVAPVRAYLRRFHAAAAATQTPSEATRMELAELGLPRAVVWGRGVDNALFSPQRRSPARREAMGAADRTLVLHVSRLAVEKDVDTLVASFRRVHNRLGDALCFVVAGDGPQADEVRAALPFAIHRGFLARAELADLYADADLFVFPSRTETCGLVVLEAMASGLPVIASNEGGVRENLRSGINGLALPGGDAAAFAAAIEELAIDRQQRHAMGQAARAFAVGRDWERELDALEPLYANARAGTPARGALAMERMVAEGGLR
jgi:glycosyltransferase involved in cell wall biosynthesis